MRILRPGATLPAAACRVPDQIWCLLIEPSLTEFLTPALSDAGIVGAEIYPHPNGDGDHHAKQDYDFDYSHRQAAQTIPSPGPLAACAAHRPN
jgi:hypothetical protein